MNTSLDVQGFSCTHFWWRLDSGLWRVLGLIPFTHDGNAVMDDFGTLVEVTK